MSHWGEDEIQRRQRVNWWAVRAVRYLGGLLWAAVSWPFRGRETKQAWFWTADWQAKEREADKALREGEYEEVKDIDELWRRLGMGDESSHKD